MATRPDMRCSTSSASPMSLRMLLRVARHAAGAGEIARQRVDDVEYRAHLPSRCGPAPRFSPRRRPPPASAPARDRAPDRAARRHPWSSLPPEIPSPRSRSSMRGSGAGDARRELAEQVVLLDGEARRARSPVAKQRHEAVLRDAEGEGCAGNHVRALEARRVDAVAEQKRAHGDALGGLGWGTGTCRLRAPGRVFL